MKHHFGGILSCRRGQPAALPPTPSAVTTLVPLSIKRWKEGVQKKQRQRNGIWEENLETQEVSWKIASSHYFSLSSLSVCQAAPTMYPVCGQLKPGLIPIREDQFWGWGKHLLLPPDLWLWWKFLSCLTLHLCFQPLLHCCYFQVMTDWISANAASELGLLQVHAPTLQSVHWPQRTHCLQT